MYYIRYADSNDARILAKIHVKSWQVAYKGIVPKEKLKQLSIKKREAYFKEVLETKNEVDAGLNALIFTNDKPTGIITFEKCRDEDKEDTVGEIWGIYLHPKYYHQGLGTYLMNWALKELKYKGYKLVTLWVLEENVNARTFYEKMGFVFDGTVKELFIGKKLNEIRYIKEVE